MSITSLYRACDYFSLFYYTIYISHAHFLKCIRSKKIQFFVVKKFLHSVYNRDRVIKKFSRAKVGEKKFFLSDKLSWLRKISYRLPKIAEELVALARISRGKGSGK